MATMTEIEKRAKRFADANRDFGDLVRNMNAEVDEIKTAHMHRIRDLATREADTLNDLKDAIAESPELFEKPRTMVLHGIKIGYMKGRGRIIIDDQAKTIERIKDHFPLLVAALIETKELPRKTAIEQLDVADLKKIGCRVEGTEDHIIAEPVDGEIEKMIEAVRKDLRMEE